MSLVQEHFDQEAARYDAWKRRNWYYYAAVKRIYQKRIPRASSVLEVGCGTGDVLAAIAPRRGVGIDISPAMIARAREKHPSLAWYACTTSELRNHLSETFDVIFLSDVIEHLEDVRGTFRDLRKFCNDRTRLLITMANPLWEPILLLLERLHMKMPEGPHERISVSALNILLLEEGFALTSHMRELLLPMYIPLLSAFANALGRLPLLRSLCLIEVLEYRLC